VLNITLCQRLTGGLLEVPNIIQACVSETRVPNKSTVCYSVVRIRQRGGVEKKKQSDRPSLLSDEIMTHVLH
jgi:hypothetical protein